MQANGVVGRIFMGRQGQQKTLPRDQYSIFTRTDCVAAGWYWLMPSKSLKRQKVVPANIIGIEIAVFRKNSGEVAALDAYCPHMGAHLAEGKVDGEQLRCFFHNWRFDDRGFCTDIPCQKSRSPRAVSTKAWTVKERYGLIWIWLGEDEPTEEIPIHPELHGKPYEYSVGNFFVKNCHPNVVMVNAIDEQHFHTVHNLPGDVLNMEPRRLSAQHIEFKNTGTVPDTSALGKFLGRFYENALTYNLDYWYGSTGTVTLGPDFLHLYLMFALRLSSTGKTEGYAIAFTRKATSPFASLFLNPLLMLLTKIAGFYFAKGDTRIFNSIKFDFKTPIASDHAVLAFIQHLEKQQPFDCSGSAYGLPFQS